MGETWKFPDISETLLKKLFIIQVIFSMNSSGSATSSAGRAGSGASPAAGSSSSRPRTAKQS